MSICCTPPILNCYINLYQLSCILRSNRYRHQEHQLSSSLPSHLVLWNQLLMPSASHDSTEANGQKEEPWDMGFQRQLGRRQFLCSEKAVRDLIKREADTGSPRSGKPTKVTVRQHQTNVRCCAKNRRKTAREHQPKIANFGGPTVPPVSLTTVC